MNVCCWESNILSVKDKLNIKNKKKKERKKVSPISPPSSFSMNKIVFIPPDCTFFFLLFAFLFRLLVLRERRSKFIELLACLSNCSSFYFSKESTEGKREES